MAKLLSRGKILAMTLLGFVLLVALVLVLGDRQVGEDSGQDASVKSANTVIINPGDNVQSIINQNPSGTTYIFKSGLYRMLTVQPKDNDTLIGEYGTIFNGSKLLNPSDAKVENGSGAGGINLYYFEGQTQQTAPKPNATGTGSSGTSKSCQTGYGRCVYNEDLFINDNFVRHAESKGEVAQGMWYFDYTNDRIYMADNPAGKKIETSVTQHAVNNWGEDNITFKNFIIEKYATAAQRHAIELMGNNNVIEYNEVRLNHGGGIKVGNSGKVRHNYVHHNGQIGLGGKNVGALFEFNEIAYNNQLGFEMTWEAGGSKWAFTDDITIRNNYSHHNIGSGLWTDIDNVGATYDGNITVFNAKNGIQHEISYDAEIMNNFSAYNGSASYEGKQIYVQISQNVDVHDNTVITNQNKTDGIIVQNYPRGTSQRFNEPWQAKNNNVYNNDLYHGISNSSVIGLEAANDQGQIFHFDTSKQTNLFYGNNYCVNNLNGTFWNYGPYGNQHKTFSYFQSQGQDVGSAITTSCTIPEIPEWNYVVGQVQDINNPAQEVPGDEDDGSVVCGSIDSNTDGEIETVDFARFVSIYKSSCSDSSETYTCGHMDSNKDGTIDIVDFVVFAQKFNQSC
jgi:hypothetical protein